jgi:hypothetical protein
MENTFFRLRREYERHKNGRPSSIFPSGSRIEIKLLAIAAHPVRGLVFDPYGTPAAKVALTLRQSTVTSFLLTQSKPDGTFEFPAVVDGEWRLSAEVESGGVKLRVAQWMEMVGHGMEG